jgi:hypothetical protein
MARLPLQLSLKELTYDDQAHACIVHSVLFRGCRRSPSRHRCGLQGLGLRF